MALDERTRAAIERTGELMCEARRLLAYGGLDGIVRRPLYYDDEHVFPQFAVSASGCEFTDSTGQTFVDWVNGWGPVLFGYRRPEIERAIVEQLAAGPTLSLMHPIEVEVARGLSEMFPCAEMVAFGKNGSDAVTAAVRVARAVTGRDEVLQYGMHGFHDWFIGTLPQVRGIPDCVRSMVHSFPYNDLERLRALFAEHRGRIAAVVMEPVREDLPKPGYLEAVRELVHAEGALLVFDEIVTAFRLANGGAQKLFGVVPDLACLGKALGNGMPISALIGRREYMQHVPAVGFGMTFRGETLTLAAARAVLDILRRERVAERLAATGEALRARFDRAAQRRGLATRLLGPPARMTIGFVRHGEWTPDRQRELFVQHALRRGVFTNGNMLASLAHDDAALDRTMRGLEGALDVLAEALGGHVHDERPIGGALSAPRALVATGFVESLIEDASGVRIGGWMLLEDGAAERLVIRVAGRPDVPVVRVARPDVASAFPSTNGADQAGFAALVPADYFRGASEHDFTLCAQRGGRDAFLCRIVRRSSAARSPIAGPMTIVDGVLYL